MKIVSFLIIFLCFYVSVFSQEIRCKINDNLAQETFYPFQKQFQNYIKQHKKQARQEGKIYTIPIIVHVMYLEGEVIGEGTNISEEQINSQIQRLNEDFRRTNSNKSDTRAEFMDVAVDTEIEFVLAYFDTLGNPLPERGIVRHLNTREKWYMQEFDSLVKPQTIWNPEQYLNIWTVDIAGVYLGYAQFPDLSGLDGGLDDEDGDETTDGVVIDYDNFGDYSIVQVPLLKDSPFNLGRTLTHEVGHFLGLIHTWGEFIGCDDEDDFCEDTPLVSSSTNGCQIDRQSCGQLSMTQNYMDYSFDSCMNLFTQNQMERMRAVLEISPRRKNLLNSPVMALEQESSHYQVKVYPNPSQDFVVLETANLNLKSYQIYNLNGQILLDGKLNKNETKINISNLLSGVYLLKIQNFNQVFIRKILVHH